jgi:hypothetical protein
MARKTKALLQTFETRAYRPFGGGSASSTSFLPSFSKFYIAATATHFLTVPMTMCEAYFSRVCKWREVERVGVS